MGIDYRIMCVYRAKDGTRHLVALRFITAAGIPRTDPIGYVKVCTIVYDKEARSLYEKITVGKGYIRENYLTSMLRRCTAYY